MDTGGEAGPIVSWGSSGSEPRKGIGSIGSYVI